MGQETDLRSFDKRVMDRYVKLGKLTDKDVEKHLKSLADLAGDALQIESKLEEHQDELLSRG